MEDFPALILFFIVYLIAGFSRKKKKKQTSSKARSPMRTRAQGEQHDRRAAARDRQTFGGFTEAFADQDVHEERPCAERRMHLHDVTQAQMMQAAEGEDPCHMGGETHKETDATYGEMDEMQETLRQDVLRGVIMSEILTRPCERMAMRRGRQREHGY